jgi:hypothetical protein
MKALKIIILSAAVLAVAGCGMSLYSGDVSQMPQDSNSIADANTMPQKADLWDVANGAIDIGITIAAMFSGAAGLRIAAGLKTARDKSKALKEIIEANELFKKSNPESANNFKTAQSQTQSDTTRQIVAQMK